ncbi:MAG: hypothetical protein CL517_01170 [Actinobacteria bacterium]|nr:hypothetical protein [Actinomycetota bacterium]|tara:strand:+ start:967 stop:1401 length:435 start_codon:yes stop_codon:yes gene_type:complete
MKKSSNENPYKLTWLTRVSTGKEKCNNCKQAIERGHKFLSYKDRDKDSWNPFCSKECLKEKVEQVEEKKIFSEKKKYIKRSALASGEWICGLCGSQWDIQFDHIEPRSKGGEDQDWNLQLLCGECNIGKHTKDHPTLDFRTREL